MRNISSETLRRAVEKSTRSSAALERRVVPPSYERSQKVERFLSARRSS